jgi:hypothetical protein
MEDYPQEIYQALGCGISQRHFQECINNLSQKDREKLKRVAQRFWFTTKLKYEGSFWTNPYVPRQKELTIIFDEIPTLEIYLLCTCLDTLAGKSEYKAFEIWVRDQNFPLDTVVSVDQVIKLYEQYQEEYGINKNLKKLFLGLSSEVKSWLVEHVTIQPESSPNISPATSSAELITRLHKFYFDVWRNAYTHSSVTRKSGITIEFLEELGHRPEWVLAQPSPFNFAGKDRKKWNIYHKANVDLALILRVVVYSASLQFLGIKPSKEIIGNYLSNLHRRRLSYWVIYEFKDNQSLLDFWVNVRFIRETLRITPIMEYLDRFIEYRFPTLASTSIKKLLKLLDPNDNFENQLIEPMQEYFQLVQEFNSIIASFNENNPPIKNSAENERRGRRNLLYDFFQRTAALPIFIKVKNYQLPASLMALMLRDPCTKIIYP